MIPFPLARSINPTNFIRARWLTQQSVLKIFLSTPLVYQVISIKTKGMLGKIKISTSSTTIFSSLLILYRFLQRIIVLCNSIYLLRASSSQNQAGSSPLIHFQVLPMGQLSTCKIWPIKFYHHLTSTRIQYWHLTVSLINYISLLEATAFKIYILTESTW